MAEERRGWLRIVFLIVLAAGLTLILRFFVFEIARVNGVSMEPALCENEVVFIEKVSKLFSLPEMGDIVVCDFWEIDETVVKRVMGLPGDKVAVTDGIFFLNGEPYKNDVFIGKMNSDMREIEVPENCIFVMGDNRNYSKDSRAPDCGPVPRWNIKGKCLFIISPLHKIAAF
jgi:signal peptidase I